MDIRKAVLIADDVALNRAILGELFKDKYEILEASDGLSAMKIISEKYRNMAVILLDLCMPNKDGYDVLDYMNFNRYSLEVPVVLISTETSPETERKALEYGASDYIRKPFHLGVVKRRVERVIKLFWENKELAITIDEQTRLLDRYLDSIINVFFSIMQYKHKPVSASIRRVQQYARKLLENLYQDSGNYYSLTPSKIAVIASASTVRDIGMLAVDDRIISRCPNLKADEWNEYQMHPVRGCEILKALAGGKNKLFIQYALEICRYHHEKWDGSGYPDGLAGDEIPISAQIISICDTYDSLRSGLIIAGNNYSHAAAIDAICKGEFGVFSPVLIESLKMVEQSFETIYMS